MDKQKQIEEMYKEFLSYKFKTAMEKFSYKEMCEYFYNAGYRKIPEGAVVLTEEELDKKLEPFRLEIISLSQELIETSQKLMKARKETAEKFAERVKEETDHGISAIYDSTVDEICKEITEGEV